MTSTLELPTPPTMRIGAGTPTRTRRDLIGTMRDVVRCRRELRTVPDELLDELRASHLATLVDAIDAYNERMTRLTLSA